MSRTLLLLSGLMACTTPPLYGLEAVPIDGATPREEAALRAELDDILQTLDARSVALTRIEVRERMPNHRITGQYRGFNAKIVVVKGNTGRMRQTLRHEVCHGIDAQYGDLHDGFAAGLLHVYRTLVDDDDMYDSDQHRRAEGFAQLCENGAGPLTALAADDYHDLIVREAAEWVLDEIVVADPEPPAGHVWVQVPDDEWPDVTVHENGVVSMDWGTTTEYIDWDGQPVASDDGSPALPLVTHRNLVDSEVGFPGHMAIAGRATSGAMVAYGTANGGQRVEVFARRPDGPWAWLGPVRWLYLGEREGEVIRIHNDVDDTVTIERFR